VEGKIQKWAQVWTSEEIDSVLKFTLLDHNKSPFGALFSPSIKRKCLKKLVSNHNN
jgi:hypothetical protein